MKTEDIMGVIIIILSLLVIFSHHVGYTVGKKREIDSVTRVWASCLYEGYSKKECGEGFIKRWAKVG